MFLILALFCCVLAAFVCAICLGAAAQQRDAAEQLALQVQRLARRRLAPEQSYSYATLGESPEPYVITLGRN
jgi:hypothetical protein